MDSTELAWRIRRHGVEMTHLSGGSHIGSVLSVADIVAVLYADEVKADKGTPAEARAKYAQQYIDEVAGAMNAAAAGLVDDVIDPAQTRKLLIAALEMLFSKRDSNPAKKHGNMPL